MLRLRVIASALFIVALSTAASAIDAPSAAPPAEATVANATDYSSAANWICRPDAETVCTSGLDAKVVDADGQAKTVPFVAAATPAIDCFYVYPTISREQTVYSDLQQTPEVQDVVNAQVGRLTSKCRVFAPVYRQVTIYGLRRMLSGSAKDDFSTPQDDVGAAWAYYLAHDNRGRGVVLVGHSQGTILLQELMSTTIDGTAQQKLLVSAFLAGDPSLAIPKGKTVGGTFAHIPVCSAKAQVGCAYAWATFLKGDASPIHQFGKLLDNGMVSACVHPSAPGGGTGSLEFFHKKPVGAPANDPPWIETLGDVFGACRLDDTGNAFVVSVAPGSQHAAMLKLFKNAEIVSGWGLHLEDVPLAQGNMLDVLDAEIATWARRHA